MIIKASTRGNAVALARHLTNTKDNDVVELHSIRGFSAQDIMGAMRESHACSLGVRSKAHLFSVSLSPPEKEIVGIDVFENAITEIEEQNGLSGQPHMVIFHEKQGRRHCHLIVSRIDTESMTVIPLPFFKRRCQQVAKQIHLDQGWDLPKGFIDKQLRDPRNFDVAEWEQSKRANRDPKQLRTLVQEAWAVSDNRTTFERALEQRGLYLARGDRRAHVALTVEGLALSIPRLLGKRTKEVRERVGDSDLRSVDQTRRHIADIVVPKLKTFLSEADQEKRRALTSLGSERAGMKRRHADERQQMDAGLAARQDAETRARAERLRHGLAGLWDRLSGKYAKLKEQNEREAWQGLQRDRAQRQSMIVAQLAEQRMLEHQRQQTRNAHATRVLKLHRDLVRQTEAPHRTVEPRAPSHDFERASRQHAQELRAQEKPSMVPQAEVRTRKQAQPPSQQPQPDKPVSQSREEWLREQQRRSRPAQRERGHDLER